MIVETVSVSFHWDWVIYLITNYGIKTCTMNMLKVIGS